MNLVTVDTVEQLKTMLGIIFFPPEDRFADIDEATLEFEEICKYLSVDTSDINPHSQDDWDNWATFEDALTIADIRKWVIEEGNLPEIKNFEPSVVIWKFDSSFDHCGDFHIRVFDIVPKAEMTPERWIERYNKYQADRAAELAEWQEQTDKLQAAGYV